MLALGAAAGISLPSILSSQPTSADYYDLPRFGNLHFLHLTDVHAQLLPIHYREPSINIGAHTSRNQPPHLVGQALLERFGVVPGSRKAHSLTHLDYVAAAAQFGQVGGFAHLATLLKRIRANRPGAVLLDGGDLWQGSATALWTRGQDMVEASKLLGVDVMTGHWEFTLGVKRVREIIETQLAGHIDFLANNVKDTDFGDAVFDSHSFREMNGIPVGIIGQAFPYTPIANPAYFTEGWTFGIQERELQKKVDEVRGAGAEVVVLLSHNGADTDLKLAARLNGIDAILGGHTHDAIPLAIPVQNRGGVTLVTNAGSHGKFLGVLDFDVRKGKIRDWSYQLLPVFANLLPPDPEMTKLISELRSPFLEKLNEPLATTESLLYRRGNFNGTFDQLICEALMAELDAPIALSPGFRWGTTLLPGDTIRLEDLMSQVAITYPEVTVTEMSGKLLKQVLEDVADNLFHPDPYYQQGGDMVRVAGINYSLSPFSKFGSRVQNIEFKGRPLEANKIYKVAGWASVRRTEGEPIWDLVSRWLKSLNQSLTIKADQPTLIGLADNLGIS